MVLVGTPIEYIGPRDKEVITPNGGRRYCFEAQEEYGGRKIEVVTSEEDLASFLYYANHANPQYNIYQIAKDVMEDMEFNLIIKCLSDNRDIFVQFISSLGFVRSGADKGQRKAAKGE